MKSFLALDVAASIAYGRVFAGEYPVRRGKVAYIYSEAIHGVVKRLDAWKRHRGISEDSRTCLLRRTASICAPRMLAVQLAKDHQRTMRPGMLAVVVDTLSKISAATMRMTLPT